MMRISKHFLSNNFILLFYLCIHICESVCVWVPRKARREHQIFGTEVLGCCEPPDRGAEN